jgi:lactoylglutathione lyase
MIKQLAHLCFYTDRPQEMLDFYHKKLGMKIKFTFNNNAGEPFGWYIDCGNLTFIEIFDQKGAIEKWGGNIASLKQGNRYQHLCLEVDHIEDFTEILKAKDIPINPVILGLDFSKQAWLKDPDGNSVELMEYTMKSLELKLVPEF